MNFYPFFSLLIFEQQYLSYYLFYQNEFSMRLPKVIFEESVSQIFKISPSYHFMSKIR